MRMKGVVVRKIILSLAAFMIVGVAAWVHAEVARSGSDPTGLRFYAYDYNDSGNIVNMASVRCFALRADGVELLGTADDSGEVVVAYEHIFRAGNLALLFCAPHADVQCTSLRLDVAHLRDLSEYDVRVTMPEMIDRIHVTVPRKPGK